MPPQSPIRQGLQSYPFTLVLVGICVLVFVIQLLNGINIANPTSQSLLTWGANFLPYSLGDQPWRMITSLFLHIGLMHLMFNMFALYYFGQVAERMFGSFNFVLLFLLSGIGGNMLNNYLGWHSILHGEMPVISAGASGGIMGIGMALLVVAMSKTPFNNMQLNFRSLLIVMAINLGYGFLVGGIDNAGHVGGSITGALLGIAYILQYRMRRHQLLLTESPTLYSQDNLPTSAIQDTNQVLLLHKDQIVIATYIGLIVLFLFIYWRLHTAYLEMVITNAAKFIY